MKPLTADRLTPDDTRWRDALARLPHDVYHLPEYCALVAKHDGGTPVALHARVNGAECFVPLVVRDVPQWLSGDRCRDGASPYGYGSPIVSPGATHDDLARCLQKCIEMAASDDVVSLFLRLHPLLPAPLGAFEAVGNIVRHGQTIPVDLTRPLAEIEQSFVRGHLYEIRKLRKQGFTVTFDDWAMLPAFGSMYRETMRRVSANAFYVFTDEYFVGLREAWGDSVHLSVAHAPDGSMTAGALFTDLGGVMQYHLSATVEEFRRVAPTKLVLAEIMKWGTERGRRTFHLGGGLGGGEDSLYRFKAGFSESRADFSTCRVICDRDRYAQLVRAWCDASRVSQVDGGYFPTYRRPVTLPSQ